LLLAGEISFSGDKGIPTNTRLQPLHDLQPRQLADIDAGAVYVRY
jgi:hypothetical protein